MKKYLILLILTAAPVLMADDNAASPDRFGVLKVDVKIGTGLNDRTPIGVSEQFSKDTEQVVGWTHVKGAKEPIDVKHVWILDGKEMRTVKVPVRSSSFRTWSYNKIKGRPGHWTLEIRDMDGRPIASKSFEVVDALP